MHLVPNLVIVMTLIQIVLLHSLVIEVQTTS